MVEQTSIQGRRDYRPTFSDAMSAVDSEIRYCTYGDTSDLIGKHFGSNSKVVDAAQRIYDALIKKKTYSPSQNKGCGKWKNLPTNPTSENQLYRPLTTLLNNITALCEPEERTFDITWQDEHAQTPYDELMADTRPDIAAVVEGGSVWRGLHTLVQVKKKSDFYPAVFQLLGYIRQAFLEQPDRRFMYGMVFSMYNLTIWHIDRSGALASEVFNVHEEPLKFITVIVSFLMLKPEELGWDPTMKVYVEEVEDGDIKLRLGIPSYEIVGDNVLCPSDAYERMWVMSVPNPAAAPEVHLQDAAAQPPAPPAEEKFVTFRSVGVLRKQVLEGRAARMWKAWKMSDMRLPKALRKVYVIKDFWRDERRIPEGVFYAHAGVCSGVALLYSHGKVRIGDRTDCTFRLVRKNVKAGGDPLDLRTDQAQAAGTEQQLRGGAASVPWSQDKFADLTGWQLAQHCLINRVHTRLVMASYGHPLHEFCSLQELLGALHDAIQGHQYLHKKGILHRDIGTNHILITGLPSPNRGILVGLENAINLRDHNTHIDDGERLGHKGFMSYELLRGKPYFSETAKRGPTGLRGTISYKPDETDERTEPGGIPYHAVHDLESFFWVLCWICVAHEGPGIIRNFKTDSMSAKAAENVFHAQKTIAATFKDKSLFASANQKKALLTDMGAFTMDILDLLTPYFKPLEKLLTWLHGELHHAYVNRNFEGLHQTFMKYLHAAEQSSPIRGWETKQSQYGKMSAAMSEQRNREDCALDTSKPYIIQKTTTPAPANTVPSAKRGRPEDEVEAPVDEATAAGPAKPKKTLATRKRQRIAGPARGEQGGNDEPVAADHVRSRTRTQAGKTAPAPTRRSTRVKNGTLKS